jgi:peptidoglycan LD-endopeptidase CwlK
MQMDPKSEALLANLDQELAAVMRMAAERTPFLWRVVQTARTIEQQRQYFREGRSRVDPDKFRTRAELYAKAKHITGPGMPFSRAVDVALVGKDPYNVEKLKQLADIVKQCAAEAKVSIRWGGDFTTLRDMPHFQKHH